MTALTLDASVIVKWFHPTTRESDLEQADAIADAYARNEFALYQPPHWRAEVAAVLARLSGSKASRDVEDLCRLDVETVDDPEAYLRAAALSIELSEHLFDTLYHAVALAVPDGTLITADDRYFRKARHVGRVTRLGDWAA